MTWSDRWTLLLLLTVVFVSGADLLVITPTLPQMARDLAVSVEVGGLWVTACAAAINVLGALLLHRAIGNR